MNSTRRRGVPVAPLSIKRIRNHANFLRERYGLGDGYLDVISLIENHLRRDGVDIDIVDESLLPFEDAETIPSHNLIRVRESIYLDACNGMPRPRFTVTHEVGHVSLHDVATLARATPGVWPIYCDSEWQADQFAAEMLMPAHGIRKRRLNPARIVDVYGVSFEAASIRWTALSSEGVL